MSELPESGVLFYDNNFWENLWSVIKKKYQKEDNEKLDIFNNEIEDIKEALYAIAERIKNQYMIKRFLTRGGAGLLFILEEIKSKEEKVLKIPRPLDLRLIESVENEREILKSLKHQNIMKVYDLGDVPLSQSI